MKQLRSGLLCALIALGSGPGTLVLKFLDAEAFLCPCPSGCGQRRVAAAEVLQHGKVEQAVWAQDLRARGLRVRVLQIQTLPV